MRGSAATAPFHPALGFKFPKREYGRSKKVLRACQASWFKEFPFLNYNTAEDSVYCHVCVRAVMEKCIISAKKPDFAFLSKGFCNWKDAKVAFKKHNDFAHHREAVESIITLPRSTWDIAELLDIDHISKIGRKPESAPDHYFKPSISWPASYYTSW